MLSCCINSQQVFHHWEEPFKHSSSSLSCHVSIYTNFFNKKPWRFLEFFLCWCCQSCLSWPLMLILSAQSAGSSHSVSHWSFSVTQHVSVVHLPQHFLLNITPISLLHFCWCVSFHTLLRTVQIYPCSAGISRTRVALCCWICHLLFMPGFVLSVIQHAVNRSVLLGCSRIHERLCSWSHGRHG